MSCSRFTFDGQVCEESCESNRSSRGDQADAQRSNAIKFNISTNLGSMGFNKKEAEKIIGDVNFCSYDLYASDTTERVMDDLFGTDAEQAAKFYTVSKLTSVGMKWEEAKQAVEGLWNQNSESFKKEGIDTDAGRMGSSLVEKGKSFFQKGANGTYTYNGPKSEEKYKRNKTDDILLKATANSRVRI